MKYTTEQMILTLRELAAHPPGLSFGEMNALFPIADRLAALQQRLDAADSEIIRLKDLCDTNWGAANYRLKYIGDIMRALGLQYDDPIERHVGDACEFARMLVLRLDKLQLRHDIMALLMPFVGHLRGCQLWHSRSEDRKCTCGLDAAVVERDKLIAESSHRPSGGIE